jgi:hypothetical protein
VARRSSETAAQAEHDQASLQSKVKSLSEKIDSLKADHLEALDTQHSRHEEQLKKRQVKDDEYDSHLQKIVDVLRCK